MFNVEFWENQLKDLSIDELNEVKKLINKFKKEKDTREEFMDVLKRWKEKFPNAKYFYTGAEWKGAYECSGEWGTNAWFDFDDFAESIYELNGTEDSDCKKLLDGCETIEDFKNTVLNTHILDGGWSNPNRRQFDEETENSKHFPIHKLTDAQDLYNGDTCHEFINIETGEKVYVYTSC